MKVEQALKHIEADSASIALRNTLCGISTPSSRAILRFRKVVKQGLKHSRIHERLHEIDTIFQDQYSFIPRDCYQDLLGFQMIGLYADNVRQRAVELLLLSMQQGRPLLYFVETLLELPTVQTQLFLRQLFVFQQAGWSSISAVPDVGQEKAAVCQTQPNDKVNSITSSYREIVREILKHRPFVLHGIFDVPQFIFLQTADSLNITDNKSENASPHNIPSLSPLFDYLGAESRNGRLDGWKLPVAARDILDFIATASPEAQLSIARYILSALRHCLSPEADAKKDPSFLSSRSSMEKVSTLDSKDMDVKAESFPSFIHPRVGPSRTATMSTDSTDSSFHPSLPFLWFAVHLGLRSEDAFDTFISGDILDLMKQLWSPGLPDYAEAHVLNGSLTRSAVRDDLRLVCCFMLGVISAVDSSLSLPQRLHDEEQEWFYDVFYTFVSRYEFINALIASVHPHRSSADLQAFYSLLLADLGGDVKIGPEDWRWDIFLTELYERREVHVANALIQLSDAELKQKVLRQAVEAAQFSNIVTRSRHRKSSGLMWLVNELVHQEAGLLSQTLDINTIVFIFMPMKGSVPTDEYDLPLFFQEFQDPRKQAAQFIGYDGHELPRNVRYFLNYLRVAPPEQLLSVSTSIVESLKALPNSVLPPSYSRLGEREMEEEALRHKEKSAVMCLQLLEFTAFLALLVPEAIRLILQADLVDVTLQLCATSAAFFPSVQLEGYTGTSVMACDLISAQCLWLLGVLASLDMDDTVRRIQESEYSAYSVGSSFECALAAQFSMKEPSINVRSSIVKLLAQIYEAEPGPPGPLYPLLDDSNSKQELIQSRTQWQDMLSVFGMEDAALEWKMGAATEVLKFCAFTPRQSWNTVFTRGLVTYPSLHRVIQFIIREYLGCESETTVTIWDEVQLALNQMRKKSQQYGFHRVHPIDRFILLVHHIGNQLQWFTTWHSRLPELGILELCKHLVQGEYDFEDVAAEVSLQEASSRRELRDIRQRRLDWFKGKLDPVQCRQPNIRPVGDTGSLFPAIEQGSFIGQSAQKSSHAKARPILVLHSSEG